MIEEKEIRIGNWFHYDPIQWNYAAHSGDFKWSSSDWFALGKSTLFLEDITPILLTKEWLLQKFGFELATDREYGGYLSPLVNGQQIRVRVNTIGIHFYTSNKRSKPLYIDYVHDLQNLIFALQKQELEVKS